MWPGEADKLVCEGTDIQLSSSEVVRQNSNAVAHTSGNLEHDVTIIHSIILIILCMLNSAGAPYCGSSQLCSPQSVTTPQSFLRQTPQ